MRLSPRTISDLAELICGGSGGSGGFNWGNFPYRSSSQLTQFFHSCNLPHGHDASTRKYWVENVLEEINQGSVIVQQLPPDSIIAVIQELMDINNEVIDTPEQFVFLYCQRFLRTLENLGESARPGNASFDTFSYFRKREEVRELLLA